MEAYLNITDDRPTTGTTIIAFSFNLNKSKYTHMYDRAAPV